MSPTARKVARLTGELDSISRRLKNLVPELQKLDLDSQVLSKDRETMGREDEHPIEFVKEVEES